MAYFPAVGILMTSSSPPMNVEVIACASNGFFFPISSHSNLIVGFKMHEHDNLVVAVIYTDVKCTLESVTMPLLNLVFLPCNLTHSLGIAIQLIVYLVTSFDCRPSPKLYNSIPMVPYAALYLRCLFFRFRLSLAVGSNKTENIRKQNGTLGNQFRVTHFVSKCFTLMLCLV